MLLLIFFHFFSIGANSAISTEYNGSVCSWQTGEPLTSSESNLGETETLQACHELVLSNEPNALAATRHVNSGTCFAKLGSIISSVQMPTSQTCIFGTSQTTSNPTTISSNSCESGQTFCDAFQSCISTRSICPSPTKAPTIESPPFCEITSYSSSQSNLDCGAISLPSTGSNCDVVANNEYVCTPETATCLSYNTWTPVTCVLISSLPTSCTTHNQCSEQYCFSSICTDYAIEGDSCQPDVVLCDPSLVCLVVDGEMTGTCSQPSSCISDSDCTDQYCSSDGFCADFLEEGTVCSSDTECGPLRVCAWKDALTNVCQNDGTCRYANCGCPDAFQHAWCTSDNSLVGPWCARSEINCGTCGGVWCTHSSSEEACAYYKIDSPLLATDVISGEPGNMLTLEGVFEKLTNTLYQSGDRFLYLGDDYKWSLNHTKAGMATSSSNINDYVQTNVDWNFHPFSSPSDITTSSVTASCTAEPLAVTQREVEGSAAAQVIFVQMAYQAVKVEQEYANGGDGSTSTYATSPHQLLDIPTRFAVLSGEDPSLTLSNVIEYFADASIKTECRAYFASLLSSDGSLNTDALEAMLSGAETCSSFTLKQLQDMRNDPDSTNWGLCAGTSDYSSRGFPSCLWMTWHGLTVNRVNMEEANGLTKLVYAVYAFYSKVYSSTYRLNFISVVNTNFYNPSAHTDCSWLMEIHNLLNTISALDESQNYFGVRDPYHPKVQWPTEDMCWNCITNVTKAEEFLRVFYADDSVSESDIQLQLASFPRQACVLGSSYSLSGDGFEPCATCTTCLSTTLSECTTSENAECMVCQTNDDCVSSQHFCSSESGCVPFLNDGALCVDPFFGLLDVQCAEGLVCDSSRTGTCRRPCTEGYDYSNDGFEPCTRCSLCLGPIETECKQDSNTVCQQLTPPSSECDLSSSGLSVGSAYPILDVAGSQFTDSILSLKLEVPMNFDSSNTRISFVDATYNDLVFEGFQNEYWTLVDDPSTCRTYYTVTVDWSYFWTMDWGGLEFIYVVAEDQYAYTGQMFFETSQLNAEGVEQTAEWTIPFVFIQPSEIYVETDSSQSSPDGAVTFRSTDDYGNPIVVGLVGVDTQISWVSMASVLSNEGNVEIDVRFYTTVPSPKRILDTGFRVDSVDNSITNARLNRILDCQCVDTASSCAMMSAYCHIFSAVCKSTCNACDQESCKQFWQLIITLDDVCDIKGKYVLGLQQYDSSTGETTVVDSGVTLTTSSACMAIGDGTTMQSSTDVFGEPHSQAIRLGFDVGDTVYFETKVVSVLAEGQTQTTTLKEVRVYQEATRLTDVIYRDGKTLSWGPNAGFSVDQISNTAVWFSFRLDPESCVTLVEDTRVVVTAIVEVTFKNGESAGRRTLAFASTSGTNRVQSQNSITIFGRGHGEGGTANVETTRENSDWQWYLIMGIFLTLSFLVAGFVCYRKVTRSKKDVVTFASINTSIAT